MDHVAAGPHRLGGRLRCAVAGRDLLDVEAALAQPRQVGALVLAPALGHQLGVGPRDPLQQDLAAGAREVQRRPVLAGEEVVEVARGEQEASAALQHRRHLPGAGGRMRGGNRRGGGRCTTDMRTPLVLLAAVAVALGPAAAASAKEIASVKVCGADGCHDVTDRATQAVVDGGAPTACARRGGALLPGQGQDEGRGRREHPGLELPSGCRRPSCCGRDDGTWMTPPSTTVDALKAGHARHRAAAGDRARAARAAAEATPATARRRRRRRPATAVAACRRASGCCSPRAASA